MRLINTLDKLHVLGAFVCYCGLQDIAIRTLPPVLRLMPSKGPHGCWEMSNMEMSFIASNFEKPCSNGVTAKLNKSEPGWARKDEQLVRGVVHWIQPQSKSFHVFRMKMHFFKEVLGTHPRPWFDLQMTSAFGIMECRMKTKNIAEDKRHRRWLSLLLLNSYLRKILFREYKSI